jgi:hypothetical protein
MITWFSQSEAYNFLYQLYGYKIHGEGPEDLKFL